MMKKVIFTAFVLAIGLWSCSQNDEINESDGDVDVTIGIKSGGLKSIIAPGGTTSWNVDDEVKVLDVNGAPRTFTYGAETPKSSAEFNGKLKAGQGNQTYRAYHAPKKSRTTLKSGRILVIEREDLDITEDGVINNSALFGSYCPMVAIPLEFDAENADNSKLFQFYHLATMIEGRISLRECEDKVYLDKKFDKVTLELKALDSKPFYTKIELDMSKLTTSSSIEDLDECIVNLDDQSVKTDFMSTTMNMTPRTIRELMYEYNSLGSFPIPIFALPTEDGFLYVATVTFYFENNIQLRMEGSAEASGLNPAGLNVLNFDHENIISE